MYINYIFYSTKENEHATKMVLTKVLFKNHVFSYKYYIYSSKQTITSQILSRVVQ